MSSLSNKPAEETSSEPSLEHANETLQLDAAAADESPLRAESMEATSGRGTGFPMP
jgi:hypothetical protein